MNGVQIVEQAITALKSDIAQTVLGYIGVALIIILPALVLRQAQKLMK